MKMCERNLQLFGLMVALMFQVQANAYGGGTTEPQATIWPIAQEVYTTAEQQVLPIAVAADMPHINPGDVSLYEPYGYSAWQIGAGLAHQKRSDLAPGYSDAPNVARLLSFFTISDIHIADKESPAQPIYVGWSAPYGPNSAGLSSAYSPILIATTHVLNAAVQTINALHEKLPFDFGISLGDAINNTQYNELRWYIDILDGKVITPSSGAHVGADTIDYQKPYQAAGLNKKIRWYQVIGNHDQFWMGSADENKKTRAAHVGSTILNMANSAEASSGGVNGSGTYMGVVDGSTSFGNIVGAGPQGDFPTPPTVVPDKKRHTLSTSESSTKNWIKQFFATSSKPVGHGFAGANLRSGFASYSFKPKSNTPIKVIALDDTCKGPDQPNYAAGCLDNNRLRWLRRQLEGGQNEGKLMIVAAHVPIQPQASLTEATPTELFAPGQEESLLTMLHRYPNLILWISGHRHVNVVTAQAYDQTLPNQGPQNSFWEVETASLRDFPQQFRTFDIRRNADNTVSIIVTNVDPAVGVADGSPAAKSRGYAIGAARIFGATPAVIADTTSHAYNAELVKQLSPEMQIKIARFGTPIE
jgi:metallophosphoesterase (TIGR03768 family)